MSFQSLVSKPKVCAAIGTLMLLLLACSEVVNLKTEGVAQKLVVYGRITDGIAGNEVSIAYTSPINGNQEPVTNAQLSLFENNVEIAQYLEYEPGRYRLFYPNDSAREGHSYELLIQLADGTQYRSLPATMPKAAAVDQLYYDASQVEVVVNQEGLEVEANLVQLFSNTRVLDPEADFYLRWNVRESYAVQERLRPGPVPPPPCYITHDISGQEAKLFNGSEVKVPEIPAVPLASTRINSRFAFQNFYQVILTTMDETAYEYWSLIDEISNTRGSIFDRPAAPVPGNLRNLNDPDEEVLGYFEVVRSDTSFIKARREDLPFRIEHPCPHSEAFREPAWCTACLLLENSTWNRPYFWDN